MENTEDDQEKVTKKVEALLDSVNSASQHVRNYYITFLLACFYIALIIWSTTDLMLLKNTPVTMPLLNVELPITGFYTFAPYFFLLLHFNLLLQFSLLADKVHRFDQAVIELPDSDSRRHYYTRLFAFVFTQILSARHHSGLLRFLLTLMVWITAIWLPLGILIGLQVGFLPYHDEDILFWQRISVMLDLLVLLIFWPVIRAPDSRWLSWIKQANVLSRLLKIIMKMKPALVSTEEPKNQNSGYPVLEGSASFLTGFCVILFAWGIAVLPDSQHEQWMANIVPAQLLTEEPLRVSNTEGKPYFLLTQYLFDRKSIEVKQGVRKASDSLFHRNLVIREQLLIANTLKAEEEADLINSDEETQQAALKKVTGLVLSGRDLRYADFSGSRLPKVDFVGANDKPSDLRYADFGNAMLINARMNRTKLWGAKMRDTKFQEADLGKAQLQGTDLIDAKLQRTKLRGAKLQEVSLEGAQLQGADLLGAKLQRANLAGAKLQGANLADAKLQGANLSNAELQGAIFANAELHGTDLTYAQLQGVNLQGAILNYADIIEAQFGWLTQSALENLQKEPITSIRDEKLRKKINTHLAGQTQEQIGIFAARGGMVWDGSYHNRFYSALNGLEFNGSEFDYQNKLAGYLIALACRDRWTADGIIENRMVESIFRKTIALAGSVAQCLLSLKDWKDEVGQLICPAMSEIDQETLKILQETAAKKNPDTSIAPFFSCRTQRSDPVSAAD